jgi:hypothetical protein
MDLNDLFMKQALEGLRTSRAQLDQAVPIMRDIRGDLTAFALHWIDKLPREPLSDGARDHGSVL